jgi:[ribosomal protein S18]-alanine N-acetyltransferase
LREGVEADAGQFFELDQLCFASGTAYSLREFQQLLRSRKTVCVVGNDEGSLAGFAIATNVENHDTCGGHIITVDVAPGFRRRGIGRSLMRRVEERMLAADAEWLRLEVAENNSAAYEFYVGLGFVPIDLIPDYYEGAIDAIVMVKGLSPLSA